MAAETITTEDRIVGKGRNRRSWIAEMEKMPSETSP